MMSEYFCPKCDKTLVARKSSFGKFYGCPGYYEKSARNPEGFDKAAGEVQCKHTQKAKYVKEVITKIPLPTFKGSDQQIAIWEEMENGTSHLIIKALAGTGKTTTIVMGAARLTGSVIALAFNNKIARELKARMPEGTATSTFHAFGWSAIRAFYKGAELKEYITHNCVDAMLPEGMDDNDKNRIKYAVVKLVSLCKNKLLAPTTENLTQLCEYHSVEIGDEVERIFELVPKVLDAARKNTREFDFDDQIWIPIVNKITLPTYDNVLVDEVQDLNMCRIEMAFTVAGKNGRIIAVGDENQAIYGFCGAAEDSMQLFERRLSA
jgi:superfamily I DNA/RNA helicase